MTTSRTSPSGDFAAEHANNTRGRKWTCLLLGKSLGNRLRACVGLIVLGCCQVLSVSAADPWVQVIGNGFGDKNNVQVSEFHVFKGQLYAGVPRNTGTGPTQLWRTSDGQNWSQVPGTAFSPSLQATATGAFISFADSGGSSPQFFYAGTIAAQGSASVIYRSTDGNSWTQINGSGTGWVPTGNVAIAPNMVVKGGFLYAGTLNSTSAQIWRTPEGDPPRWVKVLDASTLDANTNAIAYLYVFNGVIYAATGCVDAADLMCANGTAHLYSSPSGDPGTWVKNSGVGDGLGSKQTIAIASLVDFNGFLYASTHNNITGGELWRSSDAVAWTKIPGSANGFGNPLNTELHNLRVAQGQLWVTTISTSPTPFPVFRSSDGLNFIQSNVNGFGDPNNTSVKPNHFGTSIGFGNFVYWGGANTVTGAQVWRLPASALAPPGPAPSVSDGGTVNNASFTPGTTPLALGTLVAIFGTSLNDGSSNPDSAFGSDGKLLTTLGGAGVTFNGISAPVFSSFGTQLNVQVPFELAGATSASVVVTVGGQSSTPRTVPLGAASPGIFTIPSGGKGQGAIQIANTTIFAAPQGSIAGAQTRPANRGEFLTIYCTGLGNVTNRPATGAPASGNPLSVTIAPAQITIGGIPATVSFSGLSPGFVGLYQVNAQVPAGSPTGDAVPLMFTISGIQSNTVAIAVQ